ncbi:MAG: VWA domain-containing protein [Lachnospiraceae bacterium]|nr:VWA domain-containing protein [Lachnospiraceae bacterium]
MKVIDKKWSGIFLSIVLFLAVIMVPQNNVFAADAESNSTPTQFVLVLDCSGSMQESDANGLSPKAAKLFVDMVPVENTKIGVVAFGANWGAGSYVYSEEPANNTYTKIICEMTDVSTEEARERVKQAIDETSKIRDEKGYSTIGYALQAAKDMLNSNDTVQGNGCAVLMSDGRQYYLTGGKRGSEAQETKLENGAQVYKSASLEAALEAMKEKDWPVYTLEMAADIKDDYEEAERHTPSGWTGKGGFKIPTGRYYMQHIADETDGEKFTAFTQLEVQNNFAEIFNKFYEGTEAGGIEVNSEIKDGVASMDFDVSEMIAETNITITGDDMGKIESVELVDPSGSSKSYTKSTKTDARIITFEEDSYIMIKLLAPTEGKWTARVKGVDGAKLTMMTVPIRELGLLLSTGTDNSKELGKGTEVTLSAKFIYNGGSKSYFSKSFYEKNPAKLIVSKGEDLSGQTFEMEVDEKNQCYTGKINLNQTGMVRVKAVVESGHFRNDKKETGYITFSVKNRPVTKIKDMDDIDMKFNAEAEIDMNSYFEDPDQDTFMCSFDVDQTKGIDVSVDEQNVMHIKSGIKAGDVTVKIGVNDGSMDQDVTSEFTIHLENQPLKAKGPKTISKTITYNADIVPGFLKKIFGITEKSGEEINMGDYFEDPDGITPILETKDLPKDTIIQVSEDRDGILNIKGTDKGEGVFRIVAKDASDESISYEKEVIIKSISAAGWVWKQIRIPVCIALVFIIFIVIVLIALFAGRKIYGTWEVTVDNRIEGPYQLGRMAHGKKKKCSLSGVLEDTGFHAIADGGIVLKAGNNFSRSVIITGLENAASVTYRGSEYSSAEGRILRKALINQGQYIEIMVDGVQVTLNRVGK